MFNDSQLLRLRRELESLRREEADIVREIREGQNKHQQELNKLQAEFERENKQNNAKHDKALDEIKRMEKEIESTEQRLQRTADDAERHKN